MQVFNPTGSFRGDLTRVGHVVGIAPDIPHPQAPDAPQLLVYAPIAQHTPPFVRLIIAAPHAAGLAHRMRVSVGQIDPTLVPDEVQTLEELLVDRLALNRFYAALTQMFAIIGLTLTIIGTYAVTKYLVHRRRYEMGLRAALGATPRQIFAQLAANGLLMLVAGLALGYVATWLARRLINALAMNPHATDYVSLAAAGAVVATTVSTAIALSALRTVRTDPIRALREL